MATPFRLRDFCYPVAILRLRAFFERSQWLPLEQLERYQEQRLRQIIEHAYHRVPYYQGLFRKLKLIPKDIRNLADLRKIPRLSKTMLRSEFRLLQAGNKDRYRPRLYQTSGTSGEPVRFLLDKPAHVLEFVYYWRHWSWAGYRLGDRFAELTSVYFLQGEERSRLTHRYQRGLGRLLLNSLSLSAASMGEYVSCLRYYRPLFLKGTASALYFFAFFFKQRGISDIAFQAIFSTGEVLLSGQRRLIEEVFHGKVYNSYGHMERTVAVSECSQGGLHINTEYGILELIDKKPLPRLDRALPLLWRAKVIGTSLHNFSMPLLRYEVGDAVEVEEPNALCACGRAMPLVRRIHGRQEDVITTPDGGVVTTLFVVFDEVPGISLGQVVQEALNRLVVRVVRTPQYTKQCETDLLIYLRRFVGPQIQIRLEYLSPEALRRQIVGKFRTIVSCLRHETTDGPACPDASQVIGV